MVREPRDELVKQLGRQLDWLGEHWLWLLRREVIEPLAISGRDTGDRPRPTALDVGCGPGMVMDLFSDDLEVTGLDRDRDMVSMCQARGLKAVGGRAEELPFEDETFDVVYCSFLLMWLPDPAGAVSEMCRVSRSLVLFLAEPDYGARIDHPEELLPLGDALREGIRREGGDPLMGRRLMGLMSASGLRAEVGIHPGSYDKDRQREEEADQWRFIEGLTTGHVPDHELVRLRRAWERALAGGDLFQFCPIFYAIGEKVDRPIGEKLGRPIGEKVDRPIGEKLGRPIGEKVDRPIGEKMDRQGSDRRPLWKNDPR